MPTRQHTVINAAEHRGTGILFGNGNQHLPGTRLHVFTGIVALSKGTGALADNIDLHRLSG